jgi:hypothetical protein
MSQSIQEIIQEKVNYEAKYVEKYGTTTLSTCNHSNWDKNVWNYRQQIIEALKGRGYNVSCETNHGVLDIKITSL